MSVTTTCRDLSELLPVAQTACRLLFQQCYKAGIQNIFVTETYRSQARQNYLYTQGRTRPGKIVTWTLKSNHTSRLAWDIAVAPPKPLYDIDTLTKIGAIARKLGITWGGDWARRIDRPHFEVKPNWKMPRGYKLEGQVIVPSNSKMKVQLIVEDKKEEINVANTIWNPGSPAMRTEAENFISQAVKEGIIQASHLKDLRNGLMTTDRLIGLYITIQQRRSK
ncbi:M15 family peptidase [Lysinibacillus sphaericus]|uniref:Cell wall carboxypeptidase n=2 Tax=Lysinibacillus sphaericus TaxID=1421 RepID=A0A2S0K022_LYSSH|nr:M15 family metallopeptidase [Lysinibacillus sphaericus]AVK96743.1 peptidoglycan L-alanyl-D-glutamate endopeptidase [Lysinibacillus sphaericus]MED4543097.1 M15 family metallopeptidase [Lysinibacillus sphaericus]TKI16365.1 M15 family peptidase [Lysinibacillus sphaericus]SUV17440.1 cell wall carboxypeptidase [Lysinibacillus sphaericus]